MAEERQKRKHILTVRRLIVTVDRLKLTVRITVFQTLEAFLFVILKSLSLFAPPPRYASKRRRRRGQTVPVRTGRPVDKSRKE
jgi:hypothetical protein